MTAKRPWASQEELCCTKINGKSNYVSLRVLLLQNLRTKRGWKTTHAEKQIINLYWFRSCVIADIMQGDFQLWAVIDVGPNKNNATVAANPSPIPLLAYYVLLFLKLMTAIHFKVVNSRHWDTWSIVHQQLKSAQHYYSTSKLWVDNDRRICWWSDLIHTKLITDNNTDNWITLPGTCYWQGE
jgi:hypothetical protein